MSSAPSTGCAASTSRNWYSIACSSVMCSRTAVRESPSTIESTSSVEATEHLGDRAHRLLHHRGALGARGDQRREQRDHVTRRPDHEAVVHGGLRDLAAELVLGCEGLARRLVLDQLDAD